MINKLLFSAILLASICVYLIIPEIITAQPSFPDDPEQIPIDGGIAILAAAGTGYAIKNLKDKHKNKAS
jgi:hypothetical protein